MTTAPTVDTTKGASAEPFDFRHPGRAVQDGIRRLETAHEAFVERLESIFSHAAGEDVSITLRSVAQSQLGLHLRMLPGVCCRYAGTGPLKDITIRGARLGLRQLPAEEVGQRAVGNIAFTLLHPVLVRALTIAAAGEQDVALACGQPAAGSRVAIGLAGSVRRYN